jgi:hypothetical protein
MLQEKESVRKGDTCGVALSYAILHIMTLIMFLSVCVATICIDGLYAFYTLEITKKNAFRSAFSGSLIHMLTAFTVISYTQNYLYLTPLVIGSFIGTYLVVTYSRR